MSQRNVDFPPHWTRKKGGIRVPNRLTSHGTRSCGAHVSVGLERGEGAEGSGSAAVGFFPRWWSWWTWCKACGTHHGPCGLGDSTPRGKLSCFGVCCGGKLGDAWCCIGMVDSWWLLWFLVLDLTKSERFKHVQSKHQNLTKHQHGFCVGDLNMNMCRSNTETETSERGDWVWTDSGQRCDLASASCVRIARDWARGWGRSILVTGSPWPWTSPLEVTKCLDHVPGDGWWRISNFCACLARFDRFCSFHPESRRCTMSCPKWKLCKWETEQRHVHFRGDWHIWHGSRFRRPLLTRRLGGSDFYSKFLSKLCHSFGSFLINLFGSMLSWTTTLSFLKPLARFVFFGFGFVADWTRKTRVLAALLNTKISAKLECALTSSIPDTRNKHDEFLLCSDVGARGYFKSNFVFWPSLVTSRV